MKWDASGWKQMKVDESGWKWMKVVERGYKLTNMDESGWKLIKVDKNGLRVKNSKKIAVHTTYARPERRRREGWRKKANAWLSFPFQNIVLFYFFVLFFLSKSFQIDHSAISPSCVMKSLIKRYSREPLASADCSPNDGFRLQPAHPNTTFTAPPK